VIDSENDDDFSTFSTFVIYVYVYLYVTIFFKIIINTFLLFIYYMLLFFPNWE